MKSTFNCFLLIRDLLLVILIVQTISCNNIDSQESMNLIFGDSSEIEWKTEDQNQYKSLKNLLGQLNEMEAYLRHAEKQASNYQRPLVESLSGRRTSPWFK